MNRACVFREMIDGTMWGFKGIVIKENELTYTVLVWTPFNGDQEIEILKENVMFIDGK